MATEAQPAKQACGDREKGKGRRTSAPRCLWPSSSSAPGNHQLSSIARKNLAAALGTKAPLSYSRHKARDRTVGPGEVRRSVGMRRLPAISLDPVKFLQTFAAGLRAEFADAACAPVPEYLAALMRQLDGGSYRTLRGGA